ncbi:MAG TPA: sugar phosphate nucleotidyltransferase [Armatimonadota bacterium]|nr:sugar phosphate nucleotidyltransferase [Armatimonadota bacterium]
MQTVRKAVITAAGKGTRQYPASTTVQKEMLPLVDVDGITKPTIQIICEEAINSGIQEICIITNPDVDEQMRRHFRPLSAERLPSFAGKEWALKQSEKLADLEQRLTFVMQEKPEGYGHAVFQAREFVGGEPFLLLLGDHVYISRNDRPCARQVIDVFNVCRCSVSAVIPTPEHLLHLFGTIAGERISSDPDVYEVNLITEKPDLEFAEERLRVDTIRRGYYLCFFGPHVFTPGIFEALEDQISGDVRERGEIQLTSAQELLRTRERYVAFVARGERYDMGVPFGFVETQMGLALNSPFRDQVLASLIRSLAKNVPGEQLW